MFLKSSSFVDGNRVFTVDKRAKGERKKCFQSVYSCRKGPRGQEVNVFCEGPHKDVFESANCRPPAVREVRPRC